MRLYLTAVLALLAFAACSTSPSQSGAPEPQGPPSVQFDLVDTHGAQFDEDVPVRRAGSQEEAVAGSYILGHLQLAGFAPFLDPVPVRDQVRSTNVVAPPPDGDPPDVVVAVAYDTGAGGQASGRRIGLFLELARALNVAEPSHQVAFVAMGAESVEHRGSRRLAQYLIDEGWDPAVYTIGDALPEAEDALSAAGFEHTFLTEDVRSVSDEISGLLIQSRS